jgi:acyl-CoA synthetase (NDP forming)/GNAT superfamily N-acetyltransferase
VVLGNGDAVNVRPLTPADRERLGAFHARQSSESIYRRYFSPKPTLSERELDHFTNIDMVDRVALVVEQYGELLAWASYERWPGRDEAEAAFMVDDDHQGQGIATLLLEHLAAIARANGIERFTAEVLGDNRAMLAVFAKSGWPLQRRFDSGVVDLDWELADTDEFIDSVERREQRADSRAVARLLIPRAVAVIGASERPGSVGRAIWEHVAASVDGTVYAVNPRYDSILGHPCSRSVDELPDEVSLAIIVVPAAALEATIDACISKRMRGAVVVSAVDGTGVDVTALVARARRNGLRIIGPASMGIASPRPETRVQAALVDVALPPGGVAISMQSGSLGGSLLRSARALSLGVSWFVSLGDKSDISGNDLLQFWEHDENTTVIAMYTESFGNPRKFARIARRVSRSKPIVAVRTGAAASGSLGGAVYRQAGLIEVPTVPALLDTVRVLAMQPVLDGPRVAVVSNSRSPGTLAEAALSAAGLTPVTGPHPLDWTARPEDYPDALAAALGDPDVDGVLVIYAPAVEDDVAVAAQQIHDSARDAGKPVVAVLLGGADGPIVRGSDIPSFTFPEQAAAVLGRSYAYARWCDEEASIPVAVTRPIDPDRAHRLVNDALDAGGATGPTTLDLAARQELLASYGIAMAPGRATSPACARDDADAVGYPVAVKAVHRRPGRSARAGIALDLAGPDEVVEAVTVILDALGDDGADLVVQAMAPPGIDVRIRCEHDDRLGAIVAVGLGGAQADAIGDHTTRLAPVSSATAATMLRDTRVGAALDAADFDPSDLVDSIVLAAQLASDHPEIVELDLNPVIVGAGGAVVADAAVVIAPVTRDDGPLRRLS